jgi:glycerol-3-phosphate acyltransferase PlsX
MDWIKDEAGRSVILKILLACAYPILRCIKKKIDYARTGGALLLGINKPVIIAHGSSKSCAITQAILFAHKTVDENIMPAFNQSLKALLEKGKSSMTPIKKTSAEQEVQV